ncbi:hypothetical protein KO495_17350 [Colwellia sp. D2M02]|uniref:hypothetical protein n=1 Tax=Colwellia sp. D2M02 TaxID=2841562 RepID=UPI001C091FA2|nr:hypothetical protein [Colwellia sp. D2M02]MBU2895072.1 hypothetical protein [Colwellia sp. D2M02]
MKNVVLGLSLSIALTSTAFAVESTVGQVTEVDCANFTELLTAAQNTNLLDTVSVLTTSCPNFGDQIVEQAIGLAPAAQHQEIMQTVANTGVMLPGDILLAAIAGGGDVATLSEPTAGGNLAIVPPSGATAPPIIGGRNGGVIASDN